LSRSEPPEAQAGGRISDGELRGLLARAQELGLIGGGPLDDHLCHSGAFVTQVCRLTTTGATVVDLGSGGGLPGLVLAASVIDRKIILVEARAARAAHLARALTELSLTGHAQVVCQRAEILGRDPRWRGAVDMVVVRSLARPAVVAELAAPLLRTGGSLVVSGPPEDEAVVLQRWEGIDRAGLGLRVEGVAHRRPLLVRLRQAEPCPVTFPRDPAAIRRRPAF
jgi:16S rRNA (guanine527-N7)-methyltransferase